MITLALIGLKKSGKTTTAEAIIGELKQRGLKVGGLKWMVHAQFSVDTEGKDTWRHRAAGADFVLSMSQNELAFIQDRTDRPSFANMLELVPDDTDVLVCEGLEEDSPKILKLIIAKSPELLEETLRVRGIANDSSIIGVSGIMANEVSKHPDYAVYNCLKVGDVKTLVDRFLGQSLCSSNRSE